VVERVAGSKLAAVDSKLAVAVVAVKRVVDSATEVPPLSSVRSPQ
jgi:hypothetical protein